MIDAGKIAVSLGQFYTVQLVWGDHEVLENDTITVFLDKVTEPPVAIIEVNTDLPHVTVYSCANPNGILTTPAEQIELTEDDDEDNILNEILKSVQSKFRRCLH